MEGGSARVGERRREGWREGGRHGEAVGGDEAVEGEDLEHLDRGHQRAPTLHAGGHTR